MKITDIKAIPLFIPLKEIPPFSASGKTPHFYTDVLVKVFTDEGITGYGEAYRYPPATVSTFIQEGLKPYLLGENPMHVERLWNLMYTVASWEWGTKGIALYAISAVEIALWDIIGKYRGLPIYEMIGGLCKDKIKAYATLPAYETSEDVATIALRCVEQGYTAIKLHQGGDIESAKAVRQAVGYDTVLMFDANGAWWSLRQAVEKAKELEQYGVLWLEEPVWPVDDYDGLAYVKNKTDILIAAGENEYTHYGFREMIAKRAVDFIQPSVTRSGGILECRKIFALAEAWNLQIEPHSPYLGPGLAATLHLSFSNMRTEYVEIKYSPPEAPFIQPSLRPERGYVTVPDKPGLGIEINEDVVKRYPYSL